MLFKEAENKLKQNICHHIILVNSSIMKRLHNHRVLLKNDLGSIEIHWNTYLSTWTKKVKLNLLGVALPVYFPRLKALTITKPRFNKYPRHTAVCLCN